MSKLFNRAKVMKGFDYSNKFCTLLIARSQVIQKVAEIGLKVGNNNQLKESFCDSLEAICLVIEDRAIGLYNMYSDEYQGDVEDLMNKYNAFETLKSEIIKKEY
jgi:hypothetical protein